jgi:hypothetical protein
LAFAQRLPEFAFCVGHVFAKVSGGFGCLGLFDVTPTPTLPRRGGGSVASPDGFGFNRLLAAYAGGRLEGLDGLNKAVVVQVPPYYKISLTGMSTWAWLQSVLSA